MLFPKRQEVLRSQAFTLGQALNWEITRDFFLDSVIVELNFTVTTQSATAAADGILGILKKVQLQVADGSSNRLQTNVSGVSSVQESFLTTAAIDQGTLNCILQNNVLTGDTCRLRFPIWFRHPQLSDPVGSAFLLPLPRYNTNPVLSVQIATQADMDTNAAKTFAISNATARVIVNKRQVNDIDFPTLNHEFIESEKPFPASVSRDAYEWQVPGSYLSFAMRGYTSATAWGDIEQTDGFHTLELLGSTLRTLKFSDIAYENQLSQADNWSALTDTSAKFGLFSGLACYDFLHDGIGMEVGELGSVLNANVLAGSGSRVRLLQDVTGGAAVKMAYFWRRVFGDLTPYKIKLR